MDEPVKNDSLRLDKARVRYGEFLIEKSLLVIAYFSLAFIVLIFVFVFREAAPICFGSQESGSHIESQVGESESYGAEMLGDIIPEGHESRESEPQKHRTVLKSLFSLDWQPVSLDPRFGIFPLLIGSLKVALISIFISSPIAILAALFSVMFSPRWMKEFIKPIVEILAGFPSVVIGFFMLVVFASVLQNLFGYQFRLNAFAGGIALSLAIIPVIYTLSEDAMSAVPKSLIEASFALGAHAWETALFVVLPAAIPGIFAAVLLGVGRAIGETMIALMATGNAALLDMNIANPVRTVAATIGAEMAEVVFGDTHYTVLFLLGVILFIFSFGLNAFVEVFVRQRLMKRFKGAA